jgi:hypothetical protein
MYVGAVFQYCNVHFIVCISSVNAIRPEIDDVTTTGEQAGYIFHALAWTSSGGSTVNFKVTLFRLKQSFEKEFIKTKQAAMNTGFLKTFYKLP